MRSLYRSSLIRWLIILISSVGVTVLISGCTVTHTEKITHFVTRAIDSDHDQEPCEPHSTTDFLMICPVRNGVLVEGVVGNEKTKRALLDALVSSQDDINLIDHVHVRPGAKNLDFSHAGSLFEAAENIHDFALHLNAKGITLYGWTSDQTISAHVEKIAHTLWPHTHIHNEILIQH